MRMTALTTPSYPRCRGPRYALHPIFPRGRVRASDLEAWHMHLSDDLFEAAPGFEAHPGVEVRYAGGRLAEVALPAADTLFVEMDLQPDPRMLRSLAGLRGCIRWGRFDIADGRGVTSFWLDPPTPEEIRREADVHRALGLESDWIRDLIAAQLLLDQQFDQAALHKALDVLAARPREAHAVAIAMAAYDVLGLHLLPAARTLGVTVASPLRRKRDRRSRRCDLEGERVGIDRRRRRSRACGSGRRRPHATATAVKRRTAAAPGSPAAGP